MSLSRTNNKALLEIDALYLLDEHLRINFLKIYAFDSLALRKCASKEDTLKTPHSFPKSIVAKNSVQTLKRMDSLTLVALSKDTFTKMKSIFMNRILRIYTKINTLEAYIRHHQKVII